MLSKTQIRAIVAAVVVTICFVIVMISGYMFSTFNLFKSGYALCRTLSDSKSYTEVNDGIYMVGNGMDINNFFADIGYTEDPSQRMGALRSITKDDGATTHAAVTHGNSYYYIVEIDA